MKRGAETGGIKAWLKKNRLITQTGGEGSFKGNLDLGLWLDGEEDNDPGAFPSRKVPFAFSTLTTKKVAKDLHQSKRSRGNRRGWGALVASSRVHPSHASSWLPKSWQQTLLHQTRHPSAKPARFSASASISSSIHLSLSSFSPLSPHLRSAEEVRHKS